MSDRRRAPLDEIETVNSASVITAIDAWNSIAISQGVPSEGAGALAGMNETSEVRI